MAQPDSHDTSERTRDGVSPDHEAEPGRAGPWTDSDIETLIEMWHMRYSNADIADVLERAENAVAIKASRLSLPPRRVLTRNADAKIRKCLRCASSFHSFGSGNRICDPCKGSSEWMSGGDDFYRVMSGG
jgi:hypothetical protein